MDETASEERHSVLNLFNQGTGGEDDFSNPQKWLATRWRWVEYYTFWSLTRYEDRTAAMTGILRYFQRITGERPMLGLWQSSFISDLAWMGSSSNAANIPLIGPSWSWLSHPQTSISNFAFGKWSKREISALEPYLESFDEQWSRSSFTSRLVSSTLYISGVIKTFRITEDSPR